MGLDRPEAINKIYLLTYLLMLLVENKKISPNRETDTMCCTD